MGNSFTPVTNRVDPISRIEGHLGVDLNVSGTKIVDADLHGNLWRGFENFLIGREPNDAITFTQRICGVCPVPHGMTSTFGVESVLGYNDSFQTWATGHVPSSGSLAPSGAIGSGVPEKALHIRNLILGAEFLMSSITHFYHLAAPSYIQGPNIPPWTPYFNDNFYHPLLVSTGMGVNAAGGNASQSGQVGSTLPQNVAGFSKNLWSAIIKSYVKALRLRRLTFEAGALFAGRMPMTSALIAGGVGFDKKADLTDRITAFRSLINEVGEFVIQEYIPITLALGALYPEFDNVNNIPVGGHTPQGWGAGCGNYLAWGGFPQIDGTLALSRGVKVSMTGAVSVPNKDDVVANLTEDITYAHYQDPKHEFSMSGQAYPGNVTETVPDRVKATGYSWLKAPRWDGNPMEVGPMARMFVMTVIQNNVAYATSANLAGLFTDPVTSTAFAGYAQYVKGAGLDPAMIDADLAVALVRDDLCALNVGGNVYGKGAFYGAFDITSWNYNQLVTAYHHASAFIVDGQLAPLVTWILTLKGGASTIDRIRGRSLESLYLVQKLVGAFGKHTSTSVISPTTSSTPTDTSRVSVPANGGWLAQLGAVSPKDDDTFTNVSYPAVGFPVHGFGATEAPRGALMHQVTINGDKITAYQCIVPTTWNAAPKDYDGIRGPIEQAIANQANALATGNPASAVDHQNYVTTFKTNGRAYSAEGGVEALRIAQSFDPCIACAVH